MAKVSGGSALEMPPWNLPGNVLWISEIVDAGTNKSIWISSVARVS